MIYALFFIMLVYCFISYSQGYKAGFKEGKRHTEFMADGDVAGLIQ